MLESVSLLAIGFMWMLGIFDSKIVLITSHFSDFCWRSNFAMVLHQRSTMLAWVSLALAILAPLFYYIHHTLALPPRPLPSAQSGFSSFFYCDVQFWTCSYTDFLLGWCHIFWYHSGIYNEEFRISNMVRVWLTVVQFWYQHHSSLYHAKLSYLGMITIVLIW